MPTSVPSTETQNYIQFSIWHANGSIKKKKKKSWRVSASSQNKQLKEMGKLTFTSPVSQPIKNLPAMQETPVQFLGQEDPLEKG